MLKPSVIELYFVTVEILFSVSLSTTYEHTAVIPLLCGGDVSLFLALHLMLASLFY